MKNVLYYLNLLIRASDDFILEALKKYKKLLINI